MFFEVTGRPLGRIWRAPRGSRRHSWTLPATFPPVVGLYTPLAWMKRDQTQHASGVDDTLPRNIVFLVWVTLSEHKWIILRWRQRPPSFPKYACGLLKFRRIQISTHIGARYPAKKRKWSSKWTSGLKNIAQGYPLACRSQRPLRSGSPLNTSAGLKNCGNRVLLFAEQNNDRAGIQDVFGTA